jgi:hypothetical protein
LLGTIAFVFILALSTYLLRVPLTKWLITDFLPQNTQITCMAFDIGTFDIGTSPLVTIRELCFESESIAIEMYDAQWFLGDWQRKESRLSIAKLTINHKDTGLKTNENTDSPTMPNIALPTSMPRITVNTLSFTSYLLRQPLNLALEQRSLSEFSVSGDIEASVDYVDGGLKGTIDWAPKQVLEQSPLLQEKTQFLHEKLDWSALMDTNISSQFIFAGDRIETIHNLAVQTQIRFENCPVNADAKGTIGINLALSTLETVIDASGFPISATATECQLIPPQLQNLKISEAYLVAAKPVLFKDNVFTSTDVILSLPKLQAFPAVTLSDIVFGLDQDLSLIYAIDLASTLADVNIVDTALKGAVALKSSGKTLKNGSNWTVSSESAKIEITTPDSNWASAERLLNSFNYRLAFSGTELVDIALAGQQRIVGLKTKSQDNSPLNAKQIDTDWQVTRSGSKAWKIKLKNNIPEFSTAQVKVSKLNNTSNITLAPDSSMTLTGQSEIQSLAYTDKKLTNIALVHNVKTQPAPLTKKTTEKPTKFKLLGDHQLQLGSGLKVQISHTEKNVKITVAEQAVNTLQKLLSQFNNKIQLIAGTFNAEFSGTLSSSDYSGNLQVENASLKYDDFQVLFLQLNEGFTLNSAGIQLNSGKITIDELDVGIPIRKIELLVDVVDSVAKLALAQGEIIGGTFTISDLWLDGRKQRTNISVSGLNLADFVALQKQQGIQVTGEMSGVLPLQLGANDTIIEHGLLASDGPGKLKIQNNAAFDAIKDQQKELSFLQNVEYRKLSSKVELASDGWLDLELSIAGRNPDKKQEVIFNYGHKENIFTLLKSLRITRSIQDSIEKRIEQRYLEKGK